jgi:hypothetical protein
MVGFGRALGPMTEERRTLMTQMDSDAAKLIEGLVQYIRSLHSLEVNMKASPTWHEPGPVK